VRLFFAIWPDDAAAAALAGLAAAVAERVGGRAVPREKIHLTLAFVGEVGAERLDGLESAAREVRSPPFRLSLDRLGGFRHARVAWIGCGQAPVPLAVLHEQLAGSLRRRGFALEERPFNAHVTLARKAARPHPRADIEPVAWRVREFALVVSEPGTGGYRSIRSWKLRKGKSP
jgi:2'-5' RNA ligase